MTESSQLQGGLRVLAVDDDPELLKLLVEHLVRGGFTPLTAASGEAALELLAGTRVDVVLLDVDMPGLSGLEVVEQLRASGDSTPVLMLTALDSEDDVVRGLQKGADGYVTKPFGARELVARIEALHRQSRLARSAPLVLGDLTVDERTRTVTREGRSVRLTNTEFGILAYLVRQSPRTVSRRELLHEVWGIDFNPGTGILDVHLGNLRKKLRTAGSSAIETVRGEGFRAVAQG